MRTDIYGAGEEMALWVVGGGVGCFVMSVGKWELGWTARRTGYLFEEAEDDG